MRDQILNILRRLGEGESISRHDVAARLGTTCSAGGGAFAREWDAAVKDVVDEGILIVSHRRGGRYERKAGDDGARSALDRARALTRKAMRGIAQGQRLALCAPKMTSDRQMLEALDRHVDRAELLRVTAAHIQRQRKF